MGSGTIAIEKAPKKRRLYGDEEFYLRPKGGKGEHHFALRPSQNKNYLLEIEGEFGIGNMDFESKEVHSGYYSDTKYVYYSCDVEDMTEEQKKIIFKWAIDGKL